MTSQQVAPPTAAQVFASVTSLVCPLPSHAAGPPLPSPAPLTSMPDAQPPRKRHRPSGRTESWSEGVDYGRKQGLSPDADMNPLGHVTWPKEEPLDIVAGSRPQKISRPRNSVDPVSHRVIEKRRRDRMNKCLTDLSALIPASYSKQGGGRIEKTEIIEMSSRYINDLQSSSTPAASHTGNAGTTSGREVHWSRTCCTQRYYSGFKDCADELFKYLACETGRGADDPLVITLRAHLIAVSQRKLDSIRKEVKQGTLDCDPSAPRAAEPALPLLGPIAIPALAQPLPRLDPAPEPKPEPVSPAQFDPGLTSPVHPDTSSSDSGVERETSAGRVGEKTEGDPGSVPKERRHSSSSEVHRGGPLARYKFKSDIEQRFTEEKSEGIKPWREQAVRTFSTAESTCSDEGSCDTRHLATPVEEDRDGTTVPAFVLHPAGAYYMPFSLDAGLVGSVEESRGEVSSPNVHPVSIAVRFNGPVVGRNSNCETKSGSSDRNRDVEVRKFPRSRARSECLFVDKDRRL